MKKTPLKRKGKSPISKAKAKAWKEFSLWVRRRDNFTCYTCGRQGEGSFMHAGHFISRTHTATMFDEMNCRAQCMNCNIWGYGNAGIFAQKLIKEHGQEAFDNLVKRSKELKQFDVKELEEIYERYKALNK